MAARAGSEPHRTADPQELVDYARKNPGKVTYGSAGNGTNPHLAGAQLGSIAGVQLTHVPYTGIAPVVVDMLAGHVDFVVTGLTTLAPHVKSGRLKLLAVAAPERSSFMPDVPTAAEQGFADLVEAGSWFGVFTRRGTPPEVVEKIARAIKTALADPTAIQQYALLGATPMAIIGPDFDRFFLAEMTQWGAFISKNKELLKQ